MDFFMVSYDFSIFIWFSYGLPEAKPPFQRGDWTLPGAGPNGAFFGAEARRGRCELGFCSHGHGHGPVEVLWVFPCKMFFFFPSVLQRFIILATFWESKSYQPENCAHSSNEGDQIDQTVVIPSKERTQTIPREVNISRNSEVTCTHSGTWTNTENHGNIFSHAWQRMSCSLPIGQVSKLTHTLKITSFEWTVIFNPLTGSMFKYSMFK